MITERKVMDNNSEIDAGKSQPEKWERKIIEEIALSSIKEKRRARRWGIFFKFLFFIYLQVSFLSQQ